MGEHESPRSDGDDGDVERISMDVVSRIRDEEYWFEDGSVVLATSDIEFRVYKGVLADYSPVFRDMFTLPQPTSLSTIGGNPAELTADPCSVVHLSDHPGDLKHMLRICMPKSSSILNPYVTNRPSRDTISALIRLGHKYQMGVLVDHAVAYLKTWYAAPAFDTSPKWHSLYSDDSAPGQIYAIEVVQLARLIHEPSLLAPALFLCCSLGEKIVQGYKHDDGSCASLSLEDLGRCFAARSRLADETVSLLLSVFSPPASKACTISDECEEAFQDILSALKGRADLIAHPDIFRSIPLHSDSGLSAMKGHCASCSKMVKKRDADKRRELWRLLPEIMGVKDEVDEWKKSVLEG